MALLRTAPARWFGVAVAVLVLVLPFSPAQRAAAADHSLVFAALHVLEDEYVDPVEPVPLLNAAIAALRKATNQSATALADIPIGTPRAEAEAAFTATFARAVQLSLVPETQLAYAATAGMLASLRDRHTNFLNPQQYEQDHQQLLDKPAVSGIGVVITSRKDP